MLRCNYPDIRTVILQNPRKLLKSYINKGMTVLDLGCGPGFFSIEIAKMLSDSWKVITADLQEGR
jgi:ubiquinone/menaquinone biosynthesis C-methylase UbiE